MFLQVKEWLCLNCQMQRALSASEPTALPLKPQNVPNKVSPSATSQKITPRDVEPVKKELSKPDALSKMVTPVDDAAQKKGNSMPASPQKTPPTTVIQTSKAAKGPQSSTPASPVPGQKGPQDIAAASGSQKPAGQANQQELKQETVKDTPDTRQSPNLGSPKIRPDASKTAESVTGKMFGFGSSIFSSASTLISSAVQEESRTTPPGSRKMSAPAQVSPKLSAVSKISPKSSPSTSPKMSPAREPKTLSQKPNQKKEPEVTPSHTAGETLCPLCKADLNTGSKDPPNYNICTECKTTVCNQCGFNPMPMGEVSEYRHTVSKRFFSHRIVHSLFYF